LPILQTLGMDAAKLQKIDAICEESIAKQAAPGCVVLVARNGKIAYEKAFGYMTYERKSRCTPRHCMIWPPAPRSALPPWP
jgi:beta-N-acetylhexosaminidase